MYIEIINEFSEKSIYERIRYNIFRKFKKVQKDRHAQKTLVE